MLTPTEREAINDEVEQGTFDLENALDDIATEQKGEGVRRAIYGGIMLANKNGAGGPDLHARNRIADANGRIDAIESEMAQFIASHTGVVEGTRIVEDVLWTGNLYNSNDVAGLYAEIQGYDIRTYDYLDLYIKHAGKELIYRVTPNALLSDGIQLSATNLTNDTWTTELPLYASEYNLKATMFDDTWYSVEVDISVWEWSGKAAEASNQFANTSPTRALTKIVGIKHQAVDASKDAELTDMRIGADGTLYASAGGALRKQISDITVKVDDLKQYESIFTDNVDESVQNWLDEHPEATTTVQDGSLTEAKFTDALKLKTIKDYITPQMFGALGDGIADDTQAIQAAIDSQDISTIYFPKGVYMVSAPIIVAHSDQAGLSHSILMDRNAVLKASASIESVLHFTRDSTHQNNNIRDYLDGEFLEGGNIDGNGLANYCCIFDGNGRMSCSLTNFYDAITANVWVVNGRFNMYNVEVSNNFNTSENYNSAHENVIGILNDSPDSHFWDIYLSWCKFGIKNNAGAFYERIHGVMNYYGYDGSVFFEDGNTVITTITDCYSDNYNTAYKFKGSCTANRIMAYYWMSAQDLISSVYDGVTHAHNAPVVLDLSNTTQTARIIIDGLRIIPVDTETSTIIGVKIGDVDKVRTVLSRTKISNIVARYTAGTIVSDWLFYYMQKTAAPDIENEIIIANRPDLANKYIHLYDYIFYNYNKHANPVLTIKSHSENDFVSKLNTSITIGNQSTQFDSTYVAANASVLGTNGNITYYITTSIRTMLDGTQVKVMGVWMHADENTIPQILSGKCDFQASEYIGIPIRYTNFASDNAPNSTLTINAHGIAFDRVEYSCEVNSNGNSAVFTMFYANEVFEKYTPTFTFDSAFLICNGAFNTVSSGTVTCISKKASSSTWEFTFPSALSNVGNYSGILRFMNVKITFA